MRFRKEVIILVAILLGGSIFVQLKIRFEFSEQNNSSNTEISPNFLNISPAKISNSTIEINGNVEMDAFFLICREDIDSKDNLNADHSLDLIKELAKDEELVKKFT